MSKADVERETKYKIEVKNTNINHSNVFVLGCGTYENVQNPYNLYKPVGPRQSIVSSGNNPILYTDDAGGGDSVFFLAYFVTFVILLITMIIVTICECKHDWEVEMKGMEIFHTFLHC